MTSLALRRPRRLAVERAVWAVAGLLAAAIVLLIRARQLHPAPLYPDGYQYLAMAKDIAAHGRPVGPLAHGGEVFVPSADAAAKPLFPALVAVLSMCGLSLGAAARAVAALGGAATVVLAGAVAHRLSGSRLAGLVAAGACLASPSLAHWSGFAGPDALAPALVLGAALALLHRRTALAGVLAGLACTTRPELVVPVAAAALAAAAIPRLRGDALRAATWAVIALAAVLGAVRPPLVLPPGRDLAAAGVLALAGAGLLALALRRADRWCLLAAAMALVPAVAVAARAGGSS
ncbi:MAG TPA: hypothetical protein VKD47_07355, partial [Miltoncostaeaceae bacterium]|nr:hypothetical protein [Miltoncostaeaceae bacterium]